MCEPHPLLHSPACCRHNVGFGVNAPKLPTPSRTDLRSLQLRVWQAVIVAHWGYFEDSSSSHSSNGHWKYIDSRCAWGLHKVIIWYLAWVNSLAPKASFVLTCLTRQNSPSSQSHSLLWVCVWQDFLRPLALKSEDTTGRKPRGSDAMQREVIPICFSFWSVTNTALSYRSFKSSHACSFVRDSQRGSLGDIWWYIVLQDLSALLWPCGCCWGLHHLQIFFVEFNRGNLSDGWRLDWCVCRKSVNNINFIWISRKAGSGNSHMGFFFF